MAYKVFISHSSEDRDWAIALKKDCQTVGATAYIFEHDCQPGGSIAEKVLRHIQESDAVIVLLTKHGQASPYVQQEIGAASSLKKLVIPLVEGGVSKPKLALLDGKEYIEFHPGNLEPAKRKTLSYLKRHSRELVIGAVIGVIAVVALFLTIGLLGRKK